MVTTVLRAGGAVEPKTLLLPTRRRGCDDFLGFAVLCAGLEERRPGVGLSSRTFTAVLLRAGAGDLDFFTGVVRFGVLFVFGLALAFGVGVLERPRDGLLAGVLERPLVAGICLVSLTVAW
jgi:hypothetical protein